MAGHEVYAASALSAVAAILLARWCLTGGRGRPRTAAVSRWTSLRDVRRTGSTTVRAERRLPVDAACAQRAVQEAEDLVHGYWRRLDPLYLSEHDPHQH
ncbi:hypothetical protein ABZY42_21840 [Streptomyces sp. NPDC006622]|uniref:hypothetical protein n=1 Tax=Streptomyces sp. NPDC006622 TaxID=3155459 RepID=UPI0033A5FDB7